MEVSKYLSNMALSGEQGDVCLCDHQLIIKIYLDASFYYFEQIQNNVKGQ